MAKELPEGFTGINYDICQYCEHLVGEPNRDGHNYGCGLRKRQGKHARLAYDEKSVKSLAEDGIDSVNGYEGCDKFQSSGLPAFPQILEILIERNPLCSTIPSDPEATETSWDFSNKALSYLPRKNFSSRIRVQ